MKRLAGLLLLLCAAAAPVFALPLENYRHTLWRIDQALAARDLPAAQQLAGSLRGASIEWSGGSFAADRTLLDPIASATPANLLQSRRQLTATLAALASIASRVHAGAADRALLEQLRRDEAVDPLRRGGELSAAPLTPAGFWADAGERIARGWRWIRKQLIRFWDWLLSFLYAKQKSSPAPWSLSGVSFTVAALVLLIVAILLFLALEMWRRGKKQTPAVTSSEPLASLRDRDDDPLSRETSEWERRARELAAAGQIREAIRAWYHAVLVALFRAGVVQYRKGRTNWEYVAALPATLPWRGAFTALTRLFDREWYGHDRSTVEALDSCAASAQRLLESIHREGSRG